MGFRDFITSFWYRRRIEWEFVRYQNLRPPANPSRKYIDKLVKRLLDEDKAEFAMRELEMIGSAAVPSLVAALADPRYHRAEWGEEYSSVSAPLESTLELLVEHAPDEVVRVASPLVESPSAEVRKTAALHLASAGRAGTIPLLRQLLQDDDGYVRSYVSMGMERAVSGERADEAFRRQAYDLLLPQLDQQWGCATNDSAGTIIALDPARAAVDLSDERWLNLANRNVAAILGARNKANLSIPEDSLGRLLNEALPRVVGENPYPYNHVVAEALGAMALRGTPDAGAVAEGLLNHEDDRVREGAAKALVQLAGISDPVRSVNQRESAEGYAALSHEQRVVYCAFLFDAEVSNGGLMQFFGNSSGDHTADTLAALAELQHKEAHDALAEAIRLAGPLAREADRELRLTAFEGRWDELQPAFTELEAAYYATAARLRQAWLLYSIRHAGHFRGSA